ncbi:NAD-dependent succinate-semialdehyde dehydrogenase [Rothia sp. AR01]|uniref:NAD-dependent succinate-semialdehyde dehydrogenase n=1 Tax=Rothia santali TaxID=2949643 RepID=A0A9X2HF63_9MICC|nr:NAD-dependent succinate-semialdehyde dehydrogenase [Rothia santali]MCP3426154.1 NAD-dependent succinate-semialdehyde dehydrogenase [Rothia santali]
MSTFAVTNASTGEVEERFDTVDAGRIPGILDTAHKAFSSWREVPVEERARILGRVAEIFSEREDELAGIIGREMGKRLPEGRQEVQLVVQIFSWYAEHGPELLKDTALDPMGADETYVRHDPLGVLLGIMPWNFPYYQLARFAAPNLLVGNAILMKQAEICPRSAQTFAEILAEAGVPEGAYTNLFLDTDDVPRLIEDFRVRGVSLTGSERAGSIVAAQAGEHLKKSVLELGGNDPFVVLDTKDLDGLVEHAVGLRVSVQGQVCTSPKRIIVADGLYDDFVARAKQAVEALTVGAYDDPDADLGPLSSEGARDGVVERIRQAAEDGATVHTGGEKLDRPGWFMSPALITDIDEDSDLGCNELFGPAVMVYRARDEEDALRIANASQYGLQASVWTDDLERGRRFAERMEAGMVHVNEHLVTQAGLPFGGVGRSGYGRELAEWGLKEFTNEKLVRLNEQSFG